MGSVPSSFEYLADCEYNCFYEIVAFILGTIQIARTGKNRGFRPPLPPLTRTYYMDGPVRVVLKERLAKAPYLCNEENFAPFIFPLKITPKSYTRLHMNR